LNYVNLYTKDKNEISERITKRIHNTISLNSNFPPIEQLPSLVTNEQININWTKLALGYEWEGWDTNQNLVDYTHQIVYFYNQKLQVIKKFNPVNNKEEVINATDWPSKAAQLVLDIKGNRIIGWPSIKDDVYAFDLNSNKWILLFSGVHDVTACGAAFGWDATNAVPFQFGGYGYFKYKNWYWEFKESSKLMLTSSLRTGGNFILIIETLVTSGLIFCWYGLIFTNGVLYIGKVDTMVGLKEKADINLLRIVPSYLP
jgi:hypothetical protein